MAFKVFSFGSNGSGQLGIGHTDDVAIPTECKFWLRSTDQLSSELDAKPVAVAAGGNHTLLLCEDGSLYCAGQNDDGRCGVARTTEALADFCPVKLSNGPHESVNTPIKLCSATWETSTIVTNDNNVYTCGTALRGELGQGEGVTKCEIPKKLPQFCPPGAEIIHLDACMSHTVAVLSNGDVYGWGNGRKGQLGEPIGNVWVPRRIESLPFPAVYAVCGREFTCILGTPESGQCAILGPDKWGIKSNAPTTVEGWTIAAASWSNIHMLFQHGSERRLISWGRNDHGQRVPAGLPPLDPHLDSRHVLAAGSEHAIALSKSKNVLAWGWGEHGNCGEDFFGDGPHTQAWNEMTACGRFIPLGAGCATSWLVSTEHRLAS